MKIVKNKKTLVKYLLITDKSICTTNQYDGTRLVVYISMFPFKIFVREYEEYLKKFC
jgi:hypothetical protein